VPAAAVIPAPIAYIKVVAVKKLVVGSQAEVRGSYGCRLLAAWSEFTKPSLDAFKRVTRPLSTFTLKKLECSKQACSPE